MRRKKIKDICFIFYTDTGVVFYNESAIKLSCVKQFGKRTLNTQPTRLSVAAVNTI